ncbi:hypothetical protein ACWGJ2_30775 [Streptomyces sp. NPDC054796]
MGKLHRLFGVTVVSATLLGSLGAAPALAAAESADSVRGVQGLCPGDPLGLRARVTADSVAIKKNYDSSSATLKTVYKGATMAIYGLHGSWTKVQYSDRTNDWCGWVPSSSIETYS